MAACARTEESPIFIAVVGNIGVGKTGLTRVLANALNASPLVEDVFENPFFGRYYQDPVKWAFSSQVAFAADSLRRHIVALDNGSVVQDRTAYEAYDVFARVQSRMGYLNADQSRVLATLRDCASALPKQPSLLIYLHASIPSLVRRISSRDRTSEQQVDPIYLKQLQSAYDDFAKGWTISPVLPIDTDMHDLREHGEFEALLKDVLHLL